MIPDTTVALAALLISIVLATIVLIRGGRDLGIGERLGVIVLGLYLPLVVGVTLGGIPTGGYGNVPVGWAWVNLVPFATISQQLGDGLTSGMRQLTGNLLLLVPLGFLLPVANPRFRQFRTTLVAAVAVSLGIEILQLTISAVVGFPYRVFDVDDLILNTAGAALGWAGWRVTLGWFHNAPDEASYSAHP
ncbi:hypothetical protein MNBD_ACTINO01-20 [hydrothermal vent metagenome]|uniref:VanZ-like domain-containing protein n=1 Tax=hydrothermal vent metagenome TaxID=652676 RepID=A0A3B0SR68_9ZZZZ